MMAPISAAWTIKRRCPRCIGVSRGTSTRRRRSFSATVAARISRFSSLDSATPDSVRIEHGSTTMPRVRKDPLAGAAPTSRNG